MEAGATRTADLVVEIARHRDVLVVALLRPHPDLTTVAFAVEELRAAVERAAREIAPPDIALLARYVADAIRPLLAVLYATLPLVMTGSGRGDPCA